MPTPASMPQRRPGMCRETFQTGWSYECQPCPLPATHEAGSPTYPASPATRHSSSAATASSHPKQSTPSA